LDTCLQDIRFALRTLSRNKGFAVAAVVALALGIGANTTIFSVVNSVLLRPLPYPESERIVTVWNTNPRFRLGFTNLPVSSGDFTEWRNQSTVFENISVLISSTVSLSGTGEPERLGGAFVSAGFLQLMGVEPQTGRGFSAEDERVGADRVLVISDSLWRRRFGADPSIIGRAVTLDGNSYTIIGVAPSGFAFPCTTDMPPYVAAPERSDFWTVKAFTQEEAARHSDHQLVVVARLNAGVSINSAQAEMSTIAARLQLQYPESNEDVDAVVVPLQEQIVGGARIAMLVVMAAFALILLIACANVANLLLARSSVREREIAIRSALGASRGRIARQLLTESLLLSLLSGGAGALLSLWGVNLFILFSPRNVPRLDEVHTDLRALFFCLGLSIATGLLCGLAPALHASRVDLNESLKESGRGSMSGARGRRMRSVFVASEVAISVVLLAAAGLMIKSFVRLMSVEYGFDPRGVLTMRVQLDPSRYSNDKQQAAFFDSLLDQVKSLTGVDEAGATSNLPLGGGEYAGGFSIEGRPPANPSEGSTADRRVVSADYFKTMRIRLSGGREFTEHDDQTAPGVVIANESFVRRFMGGEDPIGKRIKLGDWTSNRPWLAIVGVVQDVRQRSLEAESTPCLYYPYRQRASQEMTLVMRTTVEPTTLLPAVRGAVASLDKDQPLDRVKTMDRWVGESVAARRTSAAMFVGLGLVAIVLAGWGVYAIIAYTVSQKTHEIGLRMALGAGYADIIRMVIWDGSKLALCGLIVGIGAAAALTGLISSLLFNVSPHDALTLITVSATVLLVSVGACWMPARRAASVDPMVALRHE
jgi:putative ABC transport system permease protein